MSDVICRRAFNASVIAAHLRIRESTAGMALRPSSASQGEAIMSPNQRLQNVARGPEYAGPARHRRLRVINLIMTEALIEESPGSKLRRHRLTSIVRNLRPSRNALLARRTSFPSVAASSAGRYYHCVHLRAPSRNWPAKRAGRQCAAKARSRPLRGSAADQSMAYVSARSKTLCASMALAGEIIIVSVSSS